MRKALGVMVFMAFIGAFFGGGACLVILSGIVVVCTCIINDELTSIKKDIEEIKGKEKD